MFHRSRIPTLSFNSASRQPGHNLLFGDQVKDDSGERSHGDESRDQREVLPILSLELHSSEWQGPQGIVVEQNQGCQQVVPGAGKRWCEKNPVPENPAQP